MTPTERRVRYAVGVVVIVAGLLWLVVALFLALLAVADNVFCA